MGPKCAEFLIYCEVFWHVDQPLAKQPPPTAPRSLQNPSPASQSPDYSIAWSDFGVIVGPTCREISRPTEMSYFATSTTRQLQFRHLKRPISALHLMFFCDLSRVAHLQSTFSSLFPLYTSKWVCWTAIGAPLGPKMNSMKALAGSILGPLFRSPAGVRSPPEEILTPGWRLL